MKLEEIHEQWDVDGKIDRTRFLEQGAEVYTLHAKYLRYFTSERLQLKILKSKLDTLRLAKYEHYTQGPNENTKDWFIPACGRILKSEVQQYLIADEDIKNLQARIDLAQEKVDLLEAIINMIRYRGKHISSLMDWAKWEGGA